LQIKPWFSNKRRESIKTANVLPRKTLDFQVEPGDLKNQNIAQAMSLKVGDFIVNSAGFPKMIEGIKKP
jgi:hypothetical protein